MNNATLRTTALLSLILCGCVSFEHVHFVKAQSNDGKRTQYFRFTLHGRTFFSLSAFRLGWYDKQSVEELFGLKTASKPPDADCAHPDSASTGARSDTTTASQAARSTPGAATSSPVSARTDAPAPGQGAEPDRLARRRSVPRDGTFDGAASLLGPRSGPFSDDPPAPVSSVAPASVSSDTPASVSSDTPASVSSDTPAAVTSEAPQSPEPRAEPPDDAPPAAREAEPPPAKGECPPAASPGGPTQEPRGPVTVYDVNGEPVDTVGKTLVLLLHTDADYLAQQLLNLAESDEFNDAIVRLALAEDLDQLDEARAKNDRLQALGETLKNDAARGKMRKLLERISQGNAKEAADAVRELRALLEDLLRNFARISSPLDAPDDWSNASSVREWWLRRRAVLGGSQ